jgi:hypothetical protein
MRIGRRHTFMQKGNHRTPFQLSASLNQRLGSYAVASAAVGVSLLALAPSAIGEIVYTQANVNIGHNASYGLDLNNDGIIDFIITERGGDVGSLRVNNLSARAATGNEVNCPTSFCASSFGVAVALEQGSQVGDVRQHGWIGRAVPMAFQETFAGGATSHTGSWINVRNNYLGLKFYINGAYHYGWARLTVEFQRGSGSTRTFETHLSGYAYETIPGKPIIAGQTKGNAGDDASNALTQPPAEATHAASLASLGLGANGLAIWRREEAE